MLFKDYSSIRLIKRSWEALVPNDDSRVYQTYGFNHLYEEYRKTSISAIKSKNTKCRYIVGFANEKPVCIAPICIDETPEKTIHILGHGTNAGYLDFIYNNPIYVEETLNHVKKKYNEYRMDFIFVKESSPLVRLLAKTDIFLNYNIPFIDYDSWYNSLSKSTRQNLRTAYNRIKTDNHDYELYLYHNKTSTIDNFITECNEVYQMRKLDWNNQNSGNTVINMRESKKYLKRDIVFRGMRKFENAELAVLRMDGKISGFFIGFTFDKGIYIPRLAINTVYGRYSPGMVLISEYLKRIQVNGIFNFDLCRGEESYKTKLGGMCSKTYRLSRESELIGI